MPPPAHSQALVSSTAIIPNHNTNMVDTTPTKEIDEELQLGENTSATTLPAADEQISEAVSRDDVESKLTKGAIDLSYSSGVSSRRNSSRRKGSVNLRKEALRESQLSLVALKLLGDLDLAALDDDGHDDEEALSTTLPEGEENKDTTSIKRQKLGCFRRIFLNPSYSLRKQMLLTFGAVSTLTILVIMLVSIIATFVAGYQAKEESKATAEQLIKVSLGTTARYVAEAISPRIMPVDIANIMKEFLMDRFVGYPIIEDDSATPFYSSEEGTNIYPILMDPLPMDWDFSHTPNENEGNVNESNYMEHVQNENRLSWYSEYPRLSTVNSFYFVQGACNPNATNPNSFDYFPNCTDANNDISTGGVVAPTSVNAQIAKKGATLSPLLKALFEFHHDVKEIGYYFANAGAGSLIQFPHYEVDGRSTYVSIGCDWMRQPNPINPALGPIATEEEIARCHPNGTVVPSREYNTLERGWCRDQALNPDKIHAVGPYPDAWNPSVWLITAGKAVYDSQTGALIACTLIDITLDGIQDVLDEVALEDWSAPIVARWDDGSVITAPNNFDYDTTKGPTTIDDPSLGTGVDSETFAAIRDLVDFKGRWDPKEAQTAFEVTSFGTGASNIIFASPIPPIPTEYDPLYFPEFVSVLSISKDDALKQVVTDLGETIDSQVEYLVIFTSIAGIVGIIAIILVIFASASYLTKPLRWCEMVAREIVNNFGSEKDSDIDIEHKKTSCVCSPKTELDVLTEQFIKMIKRFSRSGTAKRVVDVEQIEIRNQFHLCKEFSDLYKSREDEKNFPYSYNRKGAKEADEDAFGAKLKLNRGRNVHNRQSNTASEATPYPSPKEFQTIVWTSPLFWSIVTFIIVPLLVFSLIISVVVLTRISTFPELLEPVKEDFISLYDSYLFSSTALRASLASSLTEAVSRDLHVISRYATWLFFGALNTTDSTVDMVGGAEECKNSPMGACGWLKDQPCDCNWGWHKEGEACTNYDERSSRPLQKLHMASQSDDAWPDGSRNYTSIPFPASPEETNWWTDLSELPGSSTNVAPDNNYGTSFQRAKTASAMASVLIPFYNVLLDTLPPGLPDLPDLALMFEADGMVIGYSGCTPFPSAVSPFWSSSEANGGAVLQPELCPLGKHGYDPRCRKWYDDGKKKAFVSGLHITNPYVFAGLDGTVAQTGTSSMTNPRTKEYIGQILLDFLPLSLITMLESGTKLPKDGFSILITPDSNAVVGPGYSRKEGDVSIQQLVLQSDDCISEPQTAICVEFDEIVEMMSDGRRGADTFTRSTSTGQKETVTVRIAYAPVTVKSFLEIDSSNFASGVEQYSNLVYSVALAAPEEPMLMPFHRVRDKTETDVTIGIVVISVLLVLALLILVYFASRVTKSLITSVLHLLNVLRDMNESRLEDDHLNQMVNYIGKSCAEVDSVYATMETLFKILRSANEAFYAGELSLAYNVMKDSLRLFSRLKNKKAMAVTANNLGILCLTMYRSAVVKGDEHFGDMTLADIASEGSAYFTVAIKLGEEQYEQFYEEEGWSEECLKFMQGLANRYFNRALFSLSTKQHAKCPEEFVASGFRDIQITGDMDCEIKDQCIEMGFKIDRVERHDLMLSRSRGAESLIKLGYSPEDLFVDDIIAEILADFRRALNNPGDEFFRDVSPTGRMQIIDSELIKYCRRVLKDDVLAAKVAIRCLIEDEFILLSAFQKAVKTMLVYVRDGGDDIMINGNRKRILKGLMSYMEKLDEEFEQGASFRTRTSRQSNTLYSDVLLKSVTASAKTDDCMKGIQKAEERKSFERSSSSASVVKEATRQDFVMETF